MASGRGSTGGAAGGGGAMRARGDGSTRGDGAASTRAGDQRAAGPGGGGGGSGAGGALTAKACQPLGGVGKVRSPFADAEAGEKNRREEDKELELRPRVTHRGQPATEPRALREC